MILLSRLNGSELGVNADLIERVEATPDTVITLVDGTKYIVAEPAAEVVARIVDFRARIIATAESFASADSDARPGRTTPLRLVDSSGAAVVPITSDLIDDSGPSSARFDNTDIDRAEPVTTGQD